MMDMIRALEHELLQVLIDNVPSECRVEAPAATLLNWPQVNPEGKPDVVSDQEQVDDLLASLGF
ncbi:Protein phosphatase CheZ [compost metagenome]